MSRTADCLILGGGVIGLTLALELRSRGRAVTLLERGRIGREASWAGAGILPPPMETNVRDSLDQLRGLSHGLHFELAERLLRETGIDNGLRRCGGVYLAGSPGEAAALIGLKGLFAEHGVEATSIDLNDLKTLEPSLSPAIDAGRVRSALLCPEESQLRNPRHLAALKSACEGCDVELIESVEAQSLDVADHRIVSVSTTEDAFVADCVCVTSGAWAGALLKPLGLRTGIFPIRGQMVLYRCPSPPFSRILNEGPRYVVSREDGHCLVGSSEEEAGFEKRTTEFVQNSLESFAKQLAPQLTAERIVDRWSGLRPASFDGFPYIGPVAGFENLFVAVGHFRSGIHLSTGTARVLSQTICGDEPEVPLDAFSPSRG